MSDWNEKKLKDNSSTDYDSMTTLSNNDQNED